MVRPFTHSQFEKYLWSHNTVISQFKNYLFQRMGPTGPTPPLRCGGSRCWSHNLKIICDLTIYKSSVPTHGAHGPHASSPLWICYCNCRDADLTIWTLSVPSPLWIFTVISGMLIPQFENHLFPLRCGYIYCHCKGADLIIWKLCVPTNGPTPPLRWGYWTPLY